VLLGDNGGVKIIGLDEAKAPNESGHILVHNDPPVESQYIPPEYYRPSQSKSCQLSNKADVWAAGVLFVRMLLGTMPFDENLSPWERDIKGVDIKALSKPRSIEISD
jgi:serine/threonine protein kinase